MGIDGSSGFEEGRKGLSEIDEGSDLYYSYQMRFQLIKRTTNVWLVTKINKAPSFTYLR